MKKLTLFIFTIMFLFSCAQKEEVVNLDELLPEGAIKEITHGHPDFKVTLVAEKNANVSVKFGEKFMRVDGIEEEEVREKMAKFVLQYLENPNKAEEDKAKREAYEALPPKEKMANFIERMKSHYPDFDYEWVGLGEGNVKAEYGDNSLIIKGIDQKGGREEIAYGIIQLQKAIDELGHEEGEGEHEEGEEHEHDEGDEEHEDDNG